MIPARIPIPFCFRMVPNGQRQGHKRTGAEKQTDRGRESSGNGHSQGYGHGHG